MSLAIEYLGKFLRWSLRRLKREVSEKNMNGELPRFRSLAPKKDEISQVYVDALDFALKDSSVFNIAVTGPYGSGKSSVLESYFVQKKEYKKLSISLAQEENSSNTEPVIDEKILNQIIHQIDPKHVSASSFYRRENVSWWRLLGLTFYCWIATLTVLYLLNFRWLSSFSKSMLDEPSLLSAALAAITSEIFRVGAIIVFAVCLFFALRWMIRLQITQRVIKKLGFNDAVIEFFKDADSSIFDRHLGEVIYLLRSSGASVVVFEDLDRFDDPSVFIRLREINFVLNKGDTSNPIHFIYVFRDDMFSVNDRTKYFDFIIPIVPVADSSNAHECMIEMLKANGRLYGLDESLVSDVSLYVDEMRTIVNIINEYEVYRLITKPINWCENKLFAAVVYKNLLPNDFSKMQFGDGFAPFVLSKLRERIRRAESNRIREDIESSPKDFLGDEEDELLKKHRESLRSKLSKIENSTSFSEIIAISEEATIASVLEDSNDFAVYIEEENFPLAWHLLKKGYIDESYAEYIGRFYEHSFARGDQEYLRASLEGRSLGYAHPLRNPAGIIKRRKEVLLEQTSLNFSLFAFLLNNHHEYHTELTAQLVLIENNEVEFLLEFWHSLQNDSDKKIFSEALLFHEVDAVDSERSALLEISEYSQDSFFEIVNFMLHTIDSDSIKDLTSRQDIIDLIESKKYLAPVSLLDAQQEIFFRNIKRLNVRFSDISASILNAPDKDFVYENSAYKLNLTNLRTIAYEIFKPPISEVNFLHKNFTSIISLGKTPLLQKIESDMSGYIKCLIELNAGIRDSEEIVRRVLNDDSIPEDLLYDYLSILETEVTSLSSIDKVTVQGLVVAKGKAAINEENILLYFHEQQHLTGDLIRMINTASPPLDFSDIDFDVYGEDFKARFFKAIVNCIEFDHKRYRLAVKSLNMNLDLSSNEIAAGNIEWLIRDGIVNFSKDNLLVLREHYTWLSPLLAMQNVKAYIALLEDEPELLAISEVYALLETCISHWHKLALIDMVSEPISLKGLDVTPSVMRRIIENNFDENDFHFIFDDFSRLPAGIKRAIVEQMTTAFAVTYLKHEMILIPHEALSMLIQHGGVERNDLLHLLAIAVKGFSLEDTVDILNSMSEQDFVNALSGMRPKAELTSGGLELVKELWRKTWISSYKRIDATHEIYRIYGRRAKSQ